MNWAGCETDNSVDHNEKWCLPQVAIVLGRREGAVGTVENWRACAVTQPQGNWLPCRKVSLGLPDLTFPCQREVKFHKNT